jgi:predicted nucleotidyltransferase
MIMGLADPALEAVVARLVAALDPEQIYLFGSRARGDPGLASDYDLMVVMPDDAASELVDPRSAGKALAGVGVAVDVLLFRRSKFAAQLHLQASVPATVVREGRVVYGA